MTVRLAHRPRRITGVLIAGALSAGLVLAAPSVASADQSADLSRIAPSDASYLENRNLDAESVTDREMQLSEKYTDIGDLLDPADVEFIRIYGEALKKEPEPTRDRGTARADFNRTGSGAGGSGQMYGSMSLYTQDFTWNNSYSFTVTAVAKTSNVQKIKNCASVRAYGTVGAAGVGIVYTADPCATVNGTYHNMSRNQPYSAFVAYATIVVTSTFYTPSGSFQVSS